MNKPWSEKTWREKLDTPRKVIRKIIPWEEFQSKRIDSMCREAARRMNLADDEYLESFRDPNFRD